MKGNLDVALKELDKVVKVFSQKSFPDKIAKTFIEGAGKPMSKWSWGNQLLVYIQNTTDARGRKMWLKKGRTIISEGGKQRKPIGILAPVMIKVPKKDSVTRLVVEPKEFIPICIGFKSIPVYRYEDTKGEPLKEYKPKNIPPLLSVAEKWGVTVRYDDTARGEFGSYNPTSKEIRLCTESIDTFFHELAHIAHEKIDGKLKQGQDPEQEAIAELTACVLSTIYGYDVKDYAFNYIGHYAKDKKPLAVGKMCFKVMGKVGKVLELILTESADEKAERIWKERQPKKSKVARKKKVSKK